MIAPYFGEVREAKVQSIFFFVVIKPFLLNGPFSSCFLEVSENGAFLQHIWELMPDGLWNVCVCLFLTALVLVFLIVTVFAGRTAEYKCDTQKGIYSLLKA